MKKNKIKATVSYIVDCLVQKHYAPLYAHSQAYPSEQELPLSYLEQTLADYGGQVTVAPKNDYKIDLIRHADLPGKVFLDILLWIDQRESELTLQCTLYTDEVTTDRYPFIITEIEVM